MRGASDAPDEEQYGVVVVQNDAVTLDAVDDALEKIGKSKSGAIVRTDTVYTINGSNVQRGRMQKSPCCLTTFSKRMAVRTPIRVC